MHKVPFFLFSIFLLTAGTADAAGTKPSSFASQNLFFTDHTDIRDTRSYQRLLTSGNEGMALERAKIEYLIDRVRQSPWIFIRNGSPHDSREAARHIAQKYRRAFSRITSAAFFIHQLASFSMATGRPYLIKAENGKTYPVRDIFVNELERLEHCLQEDRPPSSQVSNSADQ